MSELIIKLKILNFLNILKKKKQFSSVSNLSYNLDFSFKNIIFIRKSLNVTCV